MIVSSLYLPSLSANWWPRSLKPALSYSPSASQCQKSSSAPATGSPAVVRTLPVTVIAVPFVEASLSEVRSGVSGL